MTCCPCCRIASLSASIVALTVLRIKTDSVSVYMWTESFPPPICFPNQRLESDCNNMRCPQRCERYSCLNFKKWINCHPRDKKKTLDLVLFSTSSLATACLSIWLCSNWAATASICLYLFHFHTPLSSHSSLCSTHTKVLSLHHHPHHSHDGQPFFVNLRAEKSN